LDRRNSAVRPKAEGARGCVDTGAPRADVPAYSADSITLEVAPKGVENPTNREAAKSREGAIVGDRPVVSDGADDAVAMKASDAVNNSDSIEHFVGAKADPG
jgi:hypothetical protein